LQNVLQLLGQARILTSASLLPRLRALLAALGRNGVEVIAVDELRSSAAADLPVHDSRRDDLALLLLTSGSTGVPKAVMQTHGALIDAARSIAQQNGFTRDEVCLNWIALEHVGGIVMCHLVFVALGSRQIQVRTDYLLQSPLRWLELIDRYRASFTWAPNFAFALINDRAAEVAAGSWRLECMRFIVNGGEAVVARTARRFLKLLAPHGLPPHAIRPAWGMSETCSAALFSNRFNLDSTRDEDELVEVGPPIPGFEVRVVDERDGLQPEGVEGRLQVRGVMVTRGYLDNPAANAEAFTVDGWFRTGDLAILRAARVTISGREKGVIIVNGVNYYAHEIEAAVEEVAGVTASFAAAFAVRVPPAQTDELAIAFHALDASDAALRRIIGGIRAAVLRRAGITPRVLLPLDKHDIPKTDIGKIQRALLARRFAAGEFDGKLRQLESRSPARRDGFDWFFRTSWQRRELRVSDQVEPGSIILGCGLDAALAAALETCARTAGADWVLVGSNQTAALAAALGDIPAAARLIVICPGRPAVAAQSDDAAIALASVDAAVRLVQAVGRQSRPAQLLFFDSEVQAVRAAETGHAGGSSLLGLLRSIPAEYAQFRVRHLDLDAQDCRNPAVLAPRLLAEVADLSDEPEVAWRGQNRYVRRLVRDADIDPSASARRWDQGFYLITGGLGGIGIELCRYLLRLGADHLLILGRRSIDQDASAQELLAELQQRGAVRYRALDIADAPACLDALAEAQRAFDRPLAGIFHLAGDYEPRLIAEETPATLAGVFRGKVGGALTTRRILAEHPHAACYAFSSVNGAMGGFAAAAYAAANAFLDAMAREQAARGRACYSLAFSMWRGVGMSGRFAPGDGASRLGYLAMDVRQALQSLAMCSVASAGHILIGLDRSHAAVSQQLPGAGAVLGFELQCPALKDLGALSLDSLRDRYGQRIPVQLAEHRERTTTARSAAPAEPLASTPETPVALAIADVWGQVLRREWIDAEANFFELGGNSVLLAQATHELSLRLGRPTAITDTFRFPTLQQLAAHYGALEDSTAPELVHSRQRGLARRARRQQRRSAAS